MAKVLFYERSTGEAEEYRRVYSGRAFWKLYMKDFLKVLRAFDNKQINVFAYILEHTNQSTNMFTGTYRSISKACNVSLSTVTQVMNLLQECDFITKYHNGSYIVSPDVLLKGDERKRGMIQRDYYSAIKETSVSKNKAITDTAAAPTDSMEAPSADEG